MGDESRVWRTYSELRAEVRGKYKILENEKLNKAEGGELQRFAIDPFVYDLWHVVKMVEQWGQRVPDLQRFYLLPQYTTVRDPDVEGETVIQDWVDSDATDTSLLGQGKEPDP